MKHAVHALAQRNAEVTPGNSEAREVDKATVRHKGRYTKMKTATNIYIFNLALADSLFLATLPFQGTDVFLGFWPFGNALCKTVVSIDYYNMFTSTFTLTVMSIDRYVAVCHPI
ncbi:unnamed protein product [Menidia menidia]|uniref:(Atlantic silverside) hypothetical protein n=1 Tax=Menidia menidia TaxID=238744 RepID=A0A8S4BUU5_9TELE|nr:unnamed protein product [Menidia menidia]